MILSEKLLALRTKAGLSQEELAEKLNVSRQSVSKWESGTSIPGIDKILEISKIYGVSTDYLLKDEMQEIPGEVVADLYHPEEVREISAETATEYLDVIKEAAKRIALGVVLCIISPIPMMSFIGMSECGLLFSQEFIATGIGVAILLAIVAVAVVLFILNGLRLEEYDYLEKEVFKLSYGVDGIIEKEETEFRPKFYQGIAIGVALCVISFVPIVIISMSEVGSDWIIHFSFALLLVIAAVGVYLIVRVAVRKGGYDRLLQRGDYTQDKKRKNERMKVFDGAYWGIITAAYLGISFAFQNWYISWIIWPIAGIIFAVIRSILSAVNGK